MAVFCSMATQHIQFERDGKGMGVGSVDPGRTRVILPGETLPQQAHWDPEIPEETEDIAVCLFNNGLVCVLFNSI